jgi:hypothetical protein
MVIDTCHKPIQLRFCHLRARTYFHVSSGPLSFGADGCGVAASMRQNPSKSPLMVQKYNMARLNFGVYGVYY